MKQDSSVALLSEQMENFSKEPNGSPRTEKYSICCCLFGFFWPCHVACGILVPRPGTEPVPPAVEVQSLNHWTAREVLKSTISEMKVILNGCNRTL